jgi:ADP-heptose:LPS heptosyltransferase/GT2 family glycosyltransferase
VSISLDGKLLGTAKTGLSRPDVGHRFPQRSAAYRSGFRFFDKLNSAIEGEHRLTIGVIGEDGQTRRMDLMVTARSASQAEHTIDDILAASTHPIMLHLDSPELIGNRATTPLRGMLTLSGWAIAQGGVDRVEVWLDEHKLGNAYLGVRREDIGMAYPDYDGALLSGFAMVVPHRAVPVGDHNVRVIVHAKSGRSSDCSFQLLSKPPDSAAGGNLRIFIPQVETDQRLAILAATGERPSHVVLVYARGEDRDGVQALAATLESLRQQTYPAWRAIVWLTDANLPTPTLDAELAQHVQFHTALELPAWEFAQFGSQVLLSSLVAGDRLSADALLELAIESALEFGADFLYGDERRYDISTRTIQPFLKPDWSPDLLLATDYIGRAWCATATLVRAAGLSPADFISKGNYDAVLRLTELAQDIRHVPRVIHQRFETAADLEPDLELQAAEAALKRRGLAGTVVPGKVPGSWRTKYEVENGNLVSIIIPTCAAGGLIEQAIRSIRACTDYPHMEIIVIDNIPDHETVWKKWIQNNVDKVINIEGIFNWSLFNNLAVKAASGKFILFLNDDVEITDPGWLRAMLEYAQHPEIGVVGPQLLYPNGTVQHAGMFLTDSHGSHAFRFLPHEEPGAFGLALTPRTVTAVTGACLLVRRSVFDAVGGFEEAHSIINNDLDFCLRVGQAGLRIVYTPYASLIHHELASRGKLGDVFDKAAFLGRWRTRFLRGDPFFNPHLAAGSSEFLPEEEPIECLYTGHPLISAAAVRRILVVKIDHIGDFLTGLPALRRLKQHFPKAEITVLAANASLKLAKLEPAIDHLIEFNFFHAVSSKGELASDVHQFSLLQAQLKNRHFDIAVDFRLQPDTRHVLRYANATLFAGYDFDRRFPWLDVAIEWEGDRRLLHKRAHVTDRLLLLADALGNACLTTPAPLPARPHAKDRSLLDAVLHRLGADKAFLKRDLVCVHPAAGNSIKQWPAASFAGLIDLLVERHAVSVILIGSETDQETVDEVLEEITHRSAVISLAGNVPLEDLEKILTPCVLYVGNDSGPKHLAAFLNLPTVGVHSANIDAKEWGPIGPRAVAVRRDVICSPCYIAHAPDCPRGVTCIRGIRVQDVYRACRPLLEFRTGRKLA